MFPCKLPIAVSHGFRFRRFFSSSSAVSGSSFKAIVSDFDETGGISNMPVVSQSLPSDASGRSAYRVQEWAKQRVFFVDENKLLHKPDNYKIIPKWQELQQRKSNDSSNEEAKHQINSSSEQASLTFESNLFLHIERLKSFLGEQYSLGSNDAFYKLLDTSFEFDYVVKQAQNGSLPKFEKSTFSLGSSKIQEMGRKLYDIAVSQLLINLKDTSTRVYLFADPQHYKIRDMALINGLNFENLENDFNSLQSDNSSLIVEFVTANQLVQTDEHELNINIPPIHRSAVLKKHLPLPTQVKHAIVKYNEKAELMLVQELHHYDEDLLREAASDTGLSKANKARLRRAILSTKSFQYKIKERKQKFRSLIKQKLLFVLIGLVALRHGTCLALRFVEDKILQGKNGMLSIATKKSFRE